MRSATLKVEFRPVIVAGEGRMQDGVRGGGERRTYQTFGVDRTTLYGALQRESV